MKSQSSELLGGRKRSTGARDSSTSALSREQLFGHLFGLFVPKQFLLDIGITPQMTQVLEIVAGGACAVLCLIGITLMIPTHHQPAHSQDLASE